MRNVIVGAARRHWDLKQNIESAGGGSRSERPVPIPAKIGDPSLIKHVFLIIRENRTCDQVLGDVSKGDRALCRRYPVAGLGAQLSRRQRR